MWELLRDFQREWGYDEPGGEPEWPREQQDEHRAAFTAERRGEADPEGPLTGVDESLPVPAALDEWWQLSFNSFVYRPRLYFTNPVWPPTVRPDPSGYGPSDGLPEDNPFLGPGDDLRVCVFKTEYQVCNEWGYLAAEATRPDPRVLVSTEDGWQLQSRSISEFFLQLAVERLPGHYGWTVRLHQDDLEEDPEIIPRLRAAYPEMGLLPWRELRMDGLAYGAPDAIVDYSQSGEADFPLVIQARTYAAAVRVATTLGVNLREGMIESPRGGPAMGQLRDVGPVSLAEGDADARGRWEVVSVQPATSAELASAAVPAGRSFPDDVPGWSVLAFDRSGSTVVVGDASGRVHVRVDGMEPRSRAIHDAPVTAVACLRLDNGRTAVVSGDASGIVRMWDLDIEPLEVPYAAREGSAVGALSIAPLLTGPGLAVAWTNGLVQVRDARSGLTSDDLWLGTGISALSLRPDASLLLTAQDAMTTVRLDLARLWPQRELRLRMDEVDWESLLTARGSAEALPDLILQAASADTSEARSAVEELRQTLHDRGRVAQAAAVAVPFLVELAADPANRVRNRVVPLLSSIAWAPDNITDAGDEELRWAREGRAAVEAAVPTLLQLLDHPHSEIRVGAAWILADFPERVPELDPALRARYAAEPDSGTAAALVLTIGELWRSSDDAPTRWLRGVLVEAPSREVRAAAATALLWCGVEDLPDGLIRALQEELNAPKSALDDTLWTLDTDRADLLTGALEAHPAALIELTAASLLTAGPADQGSFARRAGTVMRAWRAAPARLLPALAGLFPVRDRGIRQVVVDEIARGGPAVAELPEVGEALLPLLDDDSPWTAERALEALARAGDARCLPALRAALAQPLPDPTSCLAGMARHAAELVEPLHAHLASMERRTLAGVLAGIRTWGTRAEPLIPDLIGLLERRTSVSEVALTLGAVGAADEHGPDGSPATVVVPLLRDHLGTGKGRVRTSAAWALWQITGEAGDALPVLAATFVPVLTENVARRLLALGPAALPAVPYLEPLLDTHHSAAAAACVIYRVTGDPALLPRVVDAIAATELGMLAVRALDGPAAGAATTRLTEIVNSERVLAEADDENVIAVDRAYRDLAADALARIGAPAGTR
ncbi:hypothetical protein GCM10022225_83380 [Plantactinospora mayteni]|uniref:HEAT repeat domain-containing protein n=2 Tax=Plantactinospora mayteni TaxID=566021 RepID=A0ABQ4F4D5_9ACTN|nr:hypothetical protein Pma05_83330 [Plantactinospora mayteni]